MTEQIEYVALYCPKCSQPHIDVREWESKPHHKHLCHYCLHVWRIEPYSCGIDIRSPVLTQSASIHALGFDSGFKYAQAAIEAGNNHQNISGDELIKIKNCLRMLWQTYDSDGKSMGRSYAAVCLEAAIELMDGIECPNIESPSKELDEIRTHISKKFHKKLNMPNPRKEET